MHLAALGAAIFAAPPSPALDTQLASSLASFLESGQLWVALLAAFVGGLLTSLTPCVYPLIPITVRYFGGMKSGSKSRLLPMALCYVAGMVLLYASLGTLFASLKWVFGSFLANPWVLGAIALFCASMSLSMLGAFSLQLPMTLNTRLSQVGGQSYGGALAMGVVSGFIAAPCTGPVLAVILTLIANSGRVFFGFNLMVCFALGLGVPFLLLALFSGNLRKLPSSGVWMETVKLGLAVAMLVVAVYFAHLASPVFASLLQSLPRNPLLLGGATLMALVGIGAMLRMPVAADSRLLKFATVSTLSMTVSIALFGSAHSNQASKEAPIVWLADHDAGISRAQSEKRPVMVDFTADWCQACKELEHQTYVDADVQREAQRYIAIKIDATDVDDRINALFARYSVLGLPTVIFIDSAGQVLTTPRVTGFMRPAAFLEMMTSVK